MWEEFNFPEILACPLDGTKLHQSKGGLACEREHEFAIEEGVPIFAAKPRREFLPGNMPPCDIRADGQMDRFVNNWIVNTNGNLYWRVRGRLPRYPVPCWPFEAGEGKMIVDLGCGWGRWCLAASNAGFDPVGVDIHLDAVQAATRVFLQMSKQARFLCADIERLPIRSESVDCVFSYSVLQHLDREKVAAILREAARILKSGGGLCIQLPNTAGLYSTVQQMRRGFREAKSGTFEMRYWSRRQIRETLKKAGFQNIEIAADGFFSQNPQLTDLDLLSAAGKFVVSVSHAVCVVSRAFSPLVGLADSLWVRARKPETLRSEMGNATLTAIENKTMPPPLSA
jgi:ubiquinone/menaquinone biosynthesis C-methylase UbiE